MNDMSEEQHKAFAIYASQGDDRSLRRVAEILDKPLRTLERWSADFGWAKLLGKTSPAPTPEKSEPTLSAAALKLIRDAIERFSDDLTSGLPVSSNGLASLARAASALEHTAQHSERPEGEGPDYGKLSDNAFRALTALQKLATDLELTSDERRLLAHIERFQ